METEKMETEKIYCCDRGNDNVLAASILANSRKDDSAWPMMAMMNGGYNQWMNNPFAYMMMMSFMRCFGWGGEGYGYGQGQQNIEMQNQLQAIRTQLQDNQNADCIKGAIHGVEGDVRQLAQTLGCDYNTMMQVLGDVRTQLALFGEKIGCSAERVINAVERGDAGVIQALQNCCCENKQLIQKMGYENQLGQKDIVNGFQRGFSDIGFGMQQGFDRTNTGMERGFSQLGYQAQQDKCDIIRSGENNTQRIIDTLNNHWKDEMGRENQDLKAQISQLTQTGQIDKRIDRLEGLILRIAGGTGTGNNCGCGCGL